MIKTFDDVIGHLRRRPRVSMIRPDGRISLAEGPHVFLRLDEEEHMWFRAPDGHDHHIPIDLFLPLGGVHVHDGGFTVAGHGVEIVVAFLDPPETSPPAQPRDLVRELARSFELPKPGGA